MGGQQHIAQIADQCWVLLKSETYPETEVPPSCRLLIDSCTTCKIGKPKAPVLPLPVSAAARTSPPPRIKGIHSYWIAVGNLQQDCVRDNVSDATALLNTGSNLQET